MKNQIKILILLICIMMIAGCAKVALPEEKTGDIIDGKMTAPYDVKLSVDGVPYLNNEVTFTAEVVPKMTLRNMTFDFDLGDGFILTAGNTHWSGTIQKNAPLTKTISAKAVKTGYYTVRAVAQRYIKYGREGNGDVLYINVGEDSADYSHFAPIPKLPPMEYRVGMSESSLDFVMTFNEPPLLNKEVELSLMIKQYLDKKSNVNATIILPDNFKLISGDLNWNGELAPNEVVYNKIIVKAVKKGEGAIIVKAGPIYPERYTIGYDLLYFNISKDSAEVLRLWKRYVPK